MLKKSIFALLLIALIACNAVFVNAGAPSNEEEEEEEEEESEKDDGSFALGPAEVKLNFHAPAQYPVQHPFVPFYGYPYGGFPYGAYGAYGGFGAAAHPGFQPFLGPHPAAHPFAPYFGGFAEESVDISDKKADEDEQEPANAFDETMDNYKNYFSGPTSEYQWPGASEAAPGVHPTLGGTLNPFHPLGAPSHPYPFPMHQGTKNGARDPRPFTLTGEYYPGSTGLPFPPQFASFYHPYFGFGGFGAAPQPTYFPGAKNGDMTANLQTEAEEQNASPIPLWKRRQIAHRINARRN